MQLHFRGFLSYIMAIVLFDLQATKSRDDFLLEPKGRLEIVGKYSEQCGGAA